MKRLVCFFCAAAAVLLLACCTKQQATVEIVPTPGNILEYAKANPVKYEVASVDTYTIADLYDNFDDILKKVKEIVPVDPKILVDGILATHTGSYRPDTLRFKKVVLNFTGTDVNGEELVQSGVLCYNPTTTNISEQVIISRGTIGSYAESPSVNGFWPRGLLAVLPGELVLSADFIGFGKTANLPHPYLVADVTAKSQLDFTIASVLYLNSIGVGFSKPSEGFKTYSVGASQGGAAALAVHRAIEQNEQLEKCCNFKGSYCADGPYDMMATYKAYLDYGRQEMPCVMPMVINGMMTAYPDLFKGLTLDDYLSDNLKGKGVYDWLLCKKYNPIQLGEMIVEAAGGDDIRDIVAPGVVSMTAEIWKPLEIAVKRNTVADASVWVPRNKAVFHHSKNDHVVPYENQQSVVAAFPSSTCIVSGKPLHLSDHMLECIYFYVTFIDCSWRVDVMF